MRSDLGPRARQDLLQVMQRQAGVDDVLDDDDVAAFDAGIEIFREPDFAGRRGRGAVTRAGHEVDADLAVHRANQVAEKQERALEDADEMQLAGREVGADFMGECADARGEFVLIDEDGWIRCRRHRAKA